MLQPWLPIFEGELDNPSSVKQAKVIKTRLQVQELDNSSQTPNSPCQEIAASVFFLQQ